MIKLLNKYQTLEAASSKKNGKYSFFWFIIIVFILIKLILVSDLSTAVTYGPHDDSLYVDRALALLSGDGFGNYDSRVLLKYPGISLWLAFVRLLGIPFLLSINIVYVAAGLYMVTGMRRCCIPDWLVLIAFALYIFNPITMGVEWTRVMREPLSVGVLTAMVASMLHIFVGVFNAQKRFRFHLLVFSVLFSFSLYLREEDRLLWVLFILFVSSFILVIKQNNDEWLRKQWGSILLVVAIPLSCFIIYDSALRYYTKYYYGEPILHEMSEGEFPKFVAAVRSINTITDNRMVMFSQEVLGLLRKEAPMIAPVIDRLPPPGPNTLSCKLHGVCSEWSNGWMPHWIRDEVFNTGLTPTLPVSQKFYKDARLEIESACEDGRLNCTRKGNSLLPPMELRWARAYLVEAYRLAGMTLWPDPHVIELSPVMFDVPIEIGRKFAAITLTSQFDIKLQTNFNNGSELQSFISPIASLRMVILNPYRTIALILFVTIIFLYFWRICIFTKFTPLLAVSLVIGTYLLIRFLILSYVAVFMGAFDYRMVFSSYILAIFLSIPFIYDSILLKK